MPDRYKILRLFVALALMGVGIVMAIEGVYLETRNPRTNAEDLSAWGVLALATFLIGTGASIPFVRPRWAVAIGVLSPGVAFTALVAIFWGIILCNAVLKGAFRL